MPAFCPWLLCVVLALLCSPTVRAAELGPLTVSSDFGQPMRALIEVGDLSPNDAQGAVAMIASPDTYRELGVPYPSSLQGASAKLVPAADERWAIRIEGRAAVVEPDFNMVVSLITIQGRQLRNYRLMQSHAPSAGDQAAAAPEAARAVPVREPMVAAGPPIAAPPVAAPPVAAEPRLPAVRPLQPNAVTVSVAAGDTATLIARRFKPDDVTDAKAAMALFRANESRFQGSAHRLPAGAVLRVPEPEAWRALSPPQAVAALRAQAPLPGIVATSAAAGDRLVLGGGSGRARGADGAGGTGRAVRAVAHEVAMAEATSRIRELESIVEKLRRLVDATDARIRTMQQELERSRQGLVGVPTAAPAAPPTVPRTVEASVESGAEGQSVLVLALAGAVLGLLGLGGGVLYRSHRRAGRHADRRADRSDDSPMPEGLDDPRPVTERAR
jgi:pilus assembly protein FimV